MAILKKEAPESASALNVVQVDLTSDESIQKAVDEIKTKHDRLDVCINNVFLSPNASPTLVR